MADRNIRNPGPSATDLPVDLTIANQVAKIAEGAPATQLITVLLKHVAIDVGNFSRDVHSSSQVYFRSLKIYDDIQKLITKVAASTDLDTWDAFDHYTGAIPVLERILFDFYTLFYSESKDDLRAHLPPTSGVETAFIFIETWRKDREMLNRVLTDLSGDKFLILSPEIKAHLQADRQAPRSHDDINTIRAFFSYFNASKLADRDIIQQRNQKLVSDVRKLLHGIIVRSTKSPASEETGRIVIMTLMIAYIPFSLITAATTDQGWKEYLRSAIIWEAMKSLVENVDKYTASGQQPTIADLEAEWAKFKELLLKLAPTSVETKAEILELLKLAGNIRRPFHGRSVELIRMLYQLDGYSRENASVTGLRKDLKHVIDDSITSLEAAREAVSDVKTITLNEKRYKDQELDLSNTLSKIKEIYTTFGIEGQWSAKAEAYKAAENVDTSHLTMMRERLGLDKQAKQASQ